MAMHRRSMSIFSNEALEPNRWITLSNDILQGLSKVEKVTKKRNKTRYEEVFKALFEKIQDLFVISGMEVNTSPMLEHVQLRAQQRDFIRNIIKLVIACRVLSTNWDAAPVFESALMMCKEVRDSLRDLIRTRKAVEKEFRNRTKSSSAHSLKTENLREGSPRVSAYTPLSRQTSIADSMTSMMDLKYALPKPSIEDITLSGSRVFSEYEKRFSELSLRQAKELEPPLEGGNILDEMVSEGSQASRTNSEGATHTHESQSQSSNHSQLDGDSSIQSSADRTEAPECSSQAESPQLPEMSFSLPPPPMTPTQSILGALDSPDNELEDPEAYLAPVSIASDQELSGGSSQSSLRQTSDSASRRRTLTNSSGSDGSFCDSEYGGGFGSQNPLQTEESGLSVTREISQKESEDASGQTSDSDDGFIQTHISKGSISSEDLRSLKNKASHATIDSLVSTKTKDSGISSGSASIQGGGFEPTSASDSDNDTIPAMSSKPSQVFSTTGSMPRRNNSQGSLTSSHITGSEPALSHKPSMAFSESTVASTLEGSHQPSMNFSVISDRSMASNPMQALSHKASQASAMTKASTQTGDSSISGHKLATELSHITDKSSIMSEFSSREGEIEPVDSHQSSQSKDFEEISSHQSSGQSKSLEEVPSHQSSSYSRGLEEVPSHQSSGQTKSLEEVPSHQSSSYSRGLEEVPSHQSSQDRDLDSNVSSSQSGKLEEVLSHQSSYQAKSLQQVSSNQSSAQDRELDQVQSHQSSFQIQEMDSNVTSNQDELEQGFSQDLELTVSHQDSEMTIQSSDTKDFEAIHSPTGTSTESSSFFGDMKPSSDSEASEYINSKFLLPGSLELGVDTETEAGSQTAASYLSDAMESKRQSKSSRRKSFLPGMMENVLPNPAEGEDQFESNYRMSFQTQILNPGQDHFMADNRMSYQTQVSTLDKFHQANAPPVPNKNRLPVRTSSGFAIGSLMSEEEGDTSDGYQSWASKKDRTLMRMSLPIWKRNASAESLGSDTSDPDASNMSGGVLFRKPNVSMDVSDDDDENLIIRQVEEARAAKKASTLSGQPIEPQPIVLRDCAICRKVLANLIDSYSSQPVDFMEGLFMMALDTTATKTEFVDILEEMVRSLSTLFAILDGLGVQDYKQGMNVNDAALRFDLLREFTLRKDTIYSDLDDVIGLADQFALQDSPELRQGLTILLISIIKEYEELLLVSKCILNDSGFIQSFAGSMETFNAISGNNEQVGNEVKHLQESIKDLVSLNLLRREQEEQQRNPEKAAQELRAYIRNLEERQRHEEPLRPISVAASRMSMFMARPISRVQSVKSILSETSSCSVAQYPVSLFSLEREPSPPELTRQPSFSNLHQRPSYASLAAPIAARVLMEGGFSDSPVYPMLAHGTNLEAYEQPAPSPTSVPLPPSPAIPQDSGLDFLVDLSMAPREGNTEFPTDFTFSQTQSSFDNLNAALPDTVVMLQEEQMESNQFSEFETALDMVNESESGVDIENEIETVMDMDDESEAALVIDNEFETDPEDRTATAFQEIAEKEETEKEEDDSGIESIGTPEDMDMASPTSSVDKEFTIRSIPSQASIASQASTQRRGSQYIASTPMSNASSLRRKSLGDSPQELLQPTRDYSLLKPTTRFRNTSQILSWAISPLGEDLGFIITDITRSENTPVNSQHFAPIPEPTPEASAKWDDLMPEGAYAGSDLTDGPLSRQSGSPGAPKSPEAPVELPSPPPIPLLLPLVASPVSSIAAEDTHYLVGDNEYESPTTLDETEMVSRFNALMDQGRVDVDTDPEDLWPSSSQLMVAGLGEEDPVTISTHDDDLTSSSSSEWGAQSSPGPLSASSYTSSIDVASSINSAPSAIEPIESHDTAASDLTKTSQVTKASELSQNTIPSELSQNSIPSEPSHNSGPSIHFHYSEHSVHSNHSEVSVHSSHSEISVHSNHSELSNDSGHTIDAEMTRDSELTLDSQASELSTDTDDSGFTIDAEITHETVNESETTHDTENENEINSELAINPKRISVGRLIDHDLSFLTDMSFIIPRQNSMGDLDPSTSYIPSDERSSSDPEDYSYNESGSSGYMATDEHTATPDVTANDSAAIDIIQNESLQMDAIDLGVDGADNTPKPQSLATRDDATSLYDTESMPPTPNRPKVSKLAAPEDSDVEPSSVAHAALASEDDKPGDKDPSRKSSDVMTLPDMDSNPARRPSVATTNNPPDKKVSKFKRIMVLAKLRPGGRTALTYVAPHGVEFLANQPLPLNPYYANRAGAAAPEKQGRRVFRRGSNASSFSNQSNSDNNNSRMGSPNISRKNSTADGTSPSGTPRKNSTAENGSVTLSRKTSSGDVSPSQTSRKNSTADGTSAASSRKGSIASEESARQAAAAAARKAKRLSHASSRSDTVLRWYLCYNYEEEDITMKDGLIISATIEALVERLTLHDEAIDSKFMETFLLCFRSFTKAPQFLDLLIARYELKPPEGLLEDDLAIWTSHKQTAIRIRVNNTLKTWLESYFYEQDDGGCLKRLIDFCSNSMMDSMPSAAKRILNTAGEIYERLKAESSTSKVTSSKAADLMVAAAMAKLPNHIPPLPIIPKGISKSLIAHLPFRIVDLDPTEVARQLTIMDCRAFSQIRPHELIGLEFSKKTSTSVQYVRAMTDATNEITSLICDCVLKEVDIKKRCNLLKYFIRMGETLLLLKNFNSLMPIVGALNSSMIARLKKTWALLPPKFKDVFEHLRKATDHSRNYAEYRNVLKTSAPPCLPFLGIYLTDLTFTDEGNSAFSTTNTKKFVNFAKYYKTVAIVQEIQKFQVPYNLIEVRELQERLKLWMTTSNDHWDEDVFYNKSLALEPRDSSQPALTSRSRMSLKPRSSSETVVSLCSQAYF